MGNQKKMQSLKIKLFVMLMLSLSLVVKSDDTSDPNFERIFQAKHITEGDGQRFPPAGSEVSVHYTGTFPDTGKNSTPLSIETNNLNLQLKKDKLLNAGMKLYPECLLGKKLRLFVLIKWPMERMVWEMLSPLHKI